MPLTDLRRYESLVSTPVELCAADIGAAVDVCVMLCRALILHWHAWLILPCPRAAQAAAWEEVLKAVPVGPADFLGPPNHCRARSGARRNSSGRITRPNCACDHALIRWQHCSQSLQAARYGVVTLPELECCYSAGLAYTASARTNLLKTLAIGVLSTHVSFKVCHQCPKVHAYIA